MRYQAKSASQRPRILLALAVSLAACANSSGTPPGGYGADSSAPPPGNDNDAGSTEDSAVVVPPPYDSSVDQPDTSLPPIDAGPPILLPFFVSDHYIPSGFMGAGQTAMDGIKLSSAQADCKAPRPTGAGGDCYAATWTITVATGAGASWAGVYWQSPANNWGKLPGKPIAAGATKVSFYAAGKVGGESIQFLAGGINTSGSDPVLIYGDSFTSKSQPLTLTTDWVKYEIPLTGFTYGLVLGGFGWVTSATATSTTAFYIDDVQWE
jgi:hypothetical protein